MRRLVATLTAILVVGAIAVAAGATHLFDDVPDSHTHANGIEWVAENGLMVGSQGTFAPEEGLTRAQFATVLKRYHSWVATSTSITTTSTSVSSTTSSQPTTTATSSTTSTLPATTTTIEATTTTLSALENIAVIGCSTVRQAVDGYLALSSQDQLINTAQDSAVVEEWADNSINEWPWVEYANRRPSGGYDAVWLVLCEYEWALDGMTLDSGYEIAQKVWGLDPDAYFYVSPFVDFPASPECGLSGGDDTYDAGVVLAQEIVDTPAANSIHGPVLTVEATDLSDPCHLNATGRATTGSQLVDFFD